MAHREAGLSFPSGRFLPGRILAAPSWVFPGTLLDNCRFLAGRVDEVGLLFFESASSLAYGPEDLPRELADLPLRYHLHLPADLPMDKPGDAAVICVELFEKTDFLHPVCGVLHPPAADCGEDAGRVLAAFLDAFSALGGSTRLLLLENTGENDLTCLQAQIEEYDLRICLDMGHALGYGQNSLLRRDTLLQRAGMIHVNAPGRGGEAGRHLPLASLEPGEVPVARHMLRSVPPSAVVMPELFHWPHIEASLPLLSQWLEEDGPQR